MLIKVADDTYINSDRIAVLKTGNSAKVYFGGKLEMLISDTAAEYIKVMMEANESMITEDELAAQPAPSLTSRVAVILRDQFVGGATQDQIGAVLNLSLEETANELSEALAALIAETIVIAQVRDEGAPIYFHATHAPLPCRLPSADWLSSPSTASLDLSAATEAPVSAPAEYSERLEALKSDG